MYNVVNKTERIDLGSKKDLEAYDQILNDSSCVIVKEIKEKLTEKDLDSEGNVTSYREYLILIVTYQRRIVME